MTGIWVTLPEALERVSVVAGDLAKAKEELPKRLHWGELSARAARLTSQYGGGRELQYIESALWGDKPAIDWEKGNATFFLRDSRDYKRLHPYIAEGIHLQVSDLDRIWPSPNAELPGQPAADDAIIRISVEKQMVAIADIYARQFGDDPDPKDLSTHQGSIRFWCKTVLATAPYLGELGSIERVLRGHRETLRKIADSRKRMRAD